MYVLGTAGHVDHGKSRLVQALTGMDPDRLREEKERGLTIDLGFAWLTLPSGREVSVVDVPGHERFIKNMLAGAGGVDLALLVVAADEGPMPQTEEHLAILELLDVRAGVVVLTKCDLAEEEYVALVEAELTEKLAGTRLAGAPMVRTSAVTGTGLAELKATIDALLAATAPKRDLGRPRLPIDRAFTIQGFGTVVTGTLVDGALEVGQEVELQPGRLKARIRGLQRHRTKTERLEPGTRAAVNLSGVHADEVTRGMVLARPGAIRPARVVDVRLRATALLSHPLAHDAGVTFLSATAEAEGRLRLLDRDVLLPGEEAWAQVILTAPVAVVRGDRCVLRTSNETAAGGAIVALDPRRHRRKHAPTLAALVRQADGSAEERLVDLLLSGPLAVARVAEALQLEAANASAAVAATLQSGAAVQTGGVLYASAWLDAAAARAAAAASAFLAANPLRAAAPREHVRSAARIEPAAVEAVVAHAVAAGRLEERDGGGLAPPGYGVRLSPSQQAAADRFLAERRAGGASPPAADAVDPPLLAYLCEQGLVVDAGGGVVFDADVYGGLVARVLGALGANGSVSLGEVRDLLGTSRKYAQALLERMDAEKLTRRVGEVRVAGTRAEGGR